jgi:Tfp pilus assembly ATPase PilU
MATVLLPAYLREVEQKMHRLVGICLPDTVRDSVLAAVGPRGVVAYVGDPVPGRLGGLEVPVRYRRSSEYLATRAGEEPVEARELAQDTLAGIMRLHPAEQAAKEIAEALSVLTHNAWPQP